MVGPEEPAVEPSFYEQHATGHDPVNHTAFREAERRYKKKQLDTSELIDFNSISIDDERVEIIGEFEGRPVYELTAHKGFIVIPQAINAHEQQSIAESCFTQWINPPNRSNLDAHYEFCDSFAGFFQSYTDGHLEHSTAKYTQREDILSFIKKLRWVTLGHHYDWTTKLYDFTSPPNPIDHQLSHWCTKLAHTVSSDMVPEAGIINYYQPGDTLTGHVDRSEKTMSVPLVSISLGLSAVFLIGGVDRDAKVSAVLVRSGDVSLLSGPARAYYHGVPRVLPGTTPDHFADNVFLNDSRININLRQVH